MIGLPPEGGLELAGDVGVRILCSQVASVMMRHSSCINFDVREIQGTSRKAMSSCGECRSASALCTSRCPPSRLTSRQLFTESIGLSQVNVDSPPGK